MPDFEIGFVNVTIGLELAEIACNSHPRVSLDRGSVE